ncbi:MAG: PEP-CTERM sorting domain-containing protein [Myxococcota bacterium]
MLQSNRIFLALAFLLSGSPATAVMPEVTLDYEGTLDTCVGVCTLFASVGDPFTAEFRQVAPGPGTHTLGTDIGIPNVPQSQDPQSDVQNTACLRDFGVGTVVLGTASIGLHVNGAPESPGATSLDLDASNNVTGGFLNVQTLDGLPELLGQPRLITDIDVDAGTFVTMFDTGVGLVTIASGTGAFLPEPSSAWMLCVGGGAIIGLKRRKRT